MTTKVQSEFIGDAAVTTAKLADDAVATAKLADDAVTTAKLGNITSIASSGDITLDATTDIVLDAAGGDVSLKNAGNEAGKIIIGDATDPTVKITSGSAFTIDAVGDIILDADGDDIKIAEGGTVVMEIKHESSSIDFSLNTGDEDFKFKGIDSGNTVTALQLDMSDAGYAYFNSGIDVAATASRRLRFTDADGTFRAGIQAVDTGGQMIATTAQHDFAIRSQSNLLFSSGGNTERMRIASSGNFFLNTTSAMDNCFVSLQDHSNGEAFLGLSSKDDNTVGIRLGVGTSRKWVMYRDTSNNLVWYSNANGAERMRITAAGHVTLGSGANVGTAGSLTMNVGTTSTSGGLQLFAPTNVAHGINFGDAYSSSAVYAGYIEYNHPSDYMRFGTAATEVARLSGTSTGRLEVKGSTRGRIVTQNSTTGDGDSDAMSSLLNDFSSWSQIWRESWIGTAAGWGTYWAGSQGALYRRESADTNPNEYVMVGGGNKRFTFELNPGGPAYFDGTLTQNAYDYAEYFEWEDGNTSNEDRRGFTVVLTDAGLIRKATDSDNAENIIGAISGTAAVLGDAAMYDWNGKYEVDEWGTRVLDDVVTVSWTDTDHNGKKTNHAYLETEIPKDVTVPEDAGRKHHKAYRINSDYDSTKEYVPRDKRPEWGIVGLLGKVRIRDESPKNPNWKYIKTIAGKKLWLIR